MRHPFSQECDITLSLTFALYDEVADTIAENKGEVSETSWGAMKVSALIWDIVVPISISA